MRPELRESIIATAVALFNERGYGSVSLRDISGALGISVGNLNYYFAKKQDLLRAIMERNFLLTAFSEEVTTLSQLHTLITRMLDSLSAHAFYFREPALSTLNHQGEENVAAVPYLSASSGTPAGTGTFPFRHDRHCPGPSGPGPDAQPPGLGPAKPGPLHDPGRISLGPLDPAYPLSDRQGAGRVPLHHPGRLTFPSKKTPHCL